MLSWANGVQAQARGDSSGASSCVTVVGKTRRPLERRSWSCEADTESGVATEGARGVHKERMGTGDRVLVRQARCPGWTCGRDPAPRH